ncbi:hypothetical protein, partial [Mycobacterium tuberculosis]|uniref:hypothetical protein n=1 Tax=Mycobacterium tuberculosis TaxID=1773 RepID=UPI001BDDD888
VRPNGAERELRARFRPILRPQFTLGDGANGLPLAACTKTGAYVPHLPYSPIAVDPNPVPVNKGLPDGLVPATSIMRRDSLLVVKGFCI